ncbi:MAG TPA: hypothetical protein VMV57_02190 [Terracidiphilus sp.]|nr:hypothetical protein [Terracidiphilus sp.]
MSFLDKVKELAATGAAWEHTFTAWAAKEFQAFRKEEPTLIAISDRTFPYVKSVIEIALGFEGQAALVGPAGVLMDSIHAKIDTAAGLIYDFGATPTVASSIATIQSDVASIASVAGIKSAAANDALNKAVSSLAGLSTAVQGALASAPPPTA